MRRSSKLRVLIKKNVSRRKRWILLGMLICLSGIFLWLRHEFFLVHSRFVAAEGGIFTESTIGTIKNLNPLVKDATPFDKDLHKLIYMGLLRYDPISGQITDGLADFQISEDSKTYTITIKNSARFSDGSRVTIDDVFFTIETLIKNPNFPNPVLKEAFEYITINEVDNQTLEFQLPERNVFFPAFLTIPILPHSYFKEKLVTGELFIEEIVDPDYPFNKKPIGAGPYVVKNVVPNDDGSFRVFMEKNKYFYRGAPNIDQLVFYVYPSMDHLKSAKRETIMYSRIPFLQVNDFLEQLPMKEKFNLREYVLPRWVALFFHTEHTAVKNFYFRKALSLSVDKDKLLDKEKGWNRVNSYFFFDGIDENWHYTNYNEARNILQDYGFPYKKN